MNNSLILYIASLKVFVIFLSNFNDLLHFLVHFIDFYFVDIEAENFVLIHIFIGFFNSKDSYFIDPRKAQFNNLARNDFIFVVFHQDYLPFAVCLLFTHYFKNIVYIMHFVKNKVKVKSL